MNSRLLLVMIGEVILETCMELHDFFLLILLLSPGLLLSVLVMAGMSAGG